MMTAIRVAINGYGTIGSRVAEAVMKQDDMELVGVTKTRPDFRFLQARDKGIDMYAINNISEFENKSYPIAGDLLDLLGKVDVVIDCAPKRMGSKNMEVYRQFPNLRVILQGGEKHETAEVSFNSGSNYEQALGRKVIRVVSCNTTALCRIISQLNKDYKIKKVRVAIVRRSVDPGAGSKKGPVNAWEPALEYPSHHSPDLATVLPNVKVSTLAGIAPMTIMHGHMMFAEFHNNPESVEEVMEKLAENPRIKMVSSGDGFHSTAQIKDFALTKERLGNLYEVCVWKEGIGLDLDGELGMHIAIDQQADVVPENIDAIRAMFGTMEKEESITKTNASLGIVSSGKLIDVPIDIADT